MRFRPAARHPIVQALIILALALAVRALYDVELARSPSARVPVIDAETYDRQARELSSESWLGPPAPFWQPPLYPYALGAIYAAGGDLTSARRSQFLLGALTVVLVALLARRVAGSGAGWFAGIAAACYGLTLFFEGRLLPPVLILFFNTAGLAAFMIAAAARSRAGMAIAGLLFGLATVARPDAFLCALALTGGAFVLLRPRSLALIFLIAVIVPVLPVTARNAIVGNDWVWVSANGGINFYLGNNPEADRTVALRPGLEWEQLVETPHREAGLTRPSDRSRYFYDRGFDYWRSEPLSALRRAGIKLVRLASGEEIRRNEDPYQQRRESRLLSLLLWRVPGFSFPFGALLPLALFGAGVAWPRRRELWPLYAYALAYVLAVVLYFVTARYRLPILPALLVFAATGATFLWQRRHDARALTRHLGIVTVLAIAINANAATPGIATDAEYWQLRAIAHHEEGEQADAVAAQERAVREQPETPELLYDLGVYRTASGDSAGALAAYRSALSIAPDYPEALVNFGLLLARTDSLNLAVRVLLRAAEVEPDLVPAQVAVAGIYLNTGHPAVALPYYVHATTLAPQSAEAWAGRARTELALGRVAEAITSYRRRIALEGETAAGLYGLGRGLKATGRHAEALVALRRALTLDAADARIHVTLGQTLLHLHRVDEARAAYTRAIELAPQLVEAHLNLGDLYARQGLYDLAKGAFNTVLVLEREHLTALFNLGVVEAQLGATERARQLLTRVLQLDPQHARARAALEFIAAQQGQESLQESSGR